jgi:hypothetical protein
MRSAQSPRKRVLAPRVIEFFQDIETEADALVWLKDNDDIAYSEVDDLIKLFPEMFRLVPYVVENEYEPDLVLESNRRSWRREYEKTKGVNWWEDDDGRFFVRILDDDGTTTSEADDAEKLDEYPLFDENDHSDLEQETQVKDWADYGRADLRNEIERRAGFLDRDAIEELMSSVTDDMLDELVHEYYEQSGNYPEMEGASTKFPNAVEDWDGTLMQLGERLALSRHGYVVEITLSRAAFDQRGRIVLRKQDLPDKVASLVNHPDPVRVKYTADLCDNPYLTCRWTGAKEIADRQKKHDEDVGQMRLPIEERRRKHARRHAR